MKVEVAVMVKSVVYSNIEFKRFSTLQECGTAKSDVSTYCGVMLEYTL